MISKSTIDQVFDIARVEEVIGDFVQLKKAGSNYKGLSPFTDERTPSFMVSPVKQIWKDFSSGKGGNVVAFLMEHEHFTYPEAIKYLAKKYNIEVEETEQTDEQKQQANERESMFLVNDFAQSFFQDSLQTEQGKAVGLSYFKERGFSPESIENFKLGYSPDEWEAFTAAALKKGFKLDFLQKTGLSIVKEAKQFDRFKGRVMFPIHSMSGRVLGFGGRILKNDKKAAKYLNSPESEIYHKGKVLYGIFQAKQAIAKEDLCYLVEGYTDVIQFHQSGVKNTVASSGTALTSEQIHLIHRLTNNIVVLFDGDAAGQRASLRGIDLILEQGLNVRVCAFPAGEDPDSFAKKHGEAEIREYLTENAKDFISYKALVLMEESKGDPVKKADTIRDMVVSISKIPEPIKREVYIRETAQRMDISEEVLFSTLAQILARESRQKGKSVPEEKPYEGIKRVGEVKANVDPQYELERIILGLLLRYGAQQGEFRDFILREAEKGGLELSAETQKLKVYEKIYLDLQLDEIEFANASFRDLYYRIVKEYTQNETLKMDQFINQIEPEQARIITSILMADDQNRLHDWERMNIFVKDKSQLEPREINETILNLRRFLIKKKVNELAEQLAANQNENNLEILQETMEYKNLEVLIAEKLNRVI